MLSRTPSLQEPQQWQGWGWGVILTLPQEGDKHIEAGPGDRCHSCQHVGDSAVRTGGTGEDRDLVSWCHTERGSKSEAGGL